MSVCILCPRKCGVDREIMRGYCQSGGKMHIARAKLHYWEEPPISGTRGSGTIFFYRLLAALRVLPEQRDLR